MRLPKGRFERLLIKMALWVAIAALLLFAVFLAGSTWEVYQKEKQVRFDRKAAEEARDALLGRRDALSGDLEALKSERGLEAEFRERFPVVKEGEEVIVLVDAKDVSADTSGAPKRSFWERVGAWLPW